MKHKLLSAKILGKAGTQLVFVWLFVWLFADCIVWYYETLFKGVW